MAKLTEEAKNIIKNIHPALVATANKDGKPNVSAKTSFQVVDDEHVAFANIYSPKTIANLKENPYLSAIVLNPATRQGCRIWGKAEIVTSGQVFDALVAQFAPLNRKVRHAVIVSVDELVVF